jgi:hypothetical protein
MAPLLNDIGLPLIRISVDISFHNFATVVCVREENFQALLRAAGGRESTR